MRGGKQTKSAALREMLLGQCVIFLDRIFRAMDTSGDQRLDFEEFKEALRQIDHKLKSLPATAQV